MANDIAIGRQVRLHVITTSLVSIPDDVPKGDEVRWAYDELRKFLDTAMAGNDHPLQEMTTFLPSNHPDHRNRRR
jgi:hypothetical protein